MLAFPFISWVLPFLRALASVFSGLSSCLCTFFLHLASMYFSVVSSLSFSAWSIRRAGLSALCLASRRSVRALCLACVSVVVIVISYVLLVRIFHLGSCGHGAGPYCLGSLQSCSLVGKYRVWSHRYSKYRLCLGFHSMDAL